MENSDPIQPVTDVAAEAVEIVPVPSLEAEQEQATQESVQQETLAALLTADEFHERLCSIYVMAGRMPPLVIGKPELQALIQAGGDPLARPASDALYETLLELPWMHWLLERKSSVWARLAIVGAFGISVGSAVRAEIKVTWAEPEKREAPPEREPQEDGVRFSA